MINIEPEQNQISQHDISALFAHGNYAAVALNGSPEDWRTHAALGLLGRTAPAIAALKAFAAPEARFHYAALLWMDGDDAQAAALLEPLALPHAQNLLALIRKPRIHVLAQMPRDANSQWNLLEGAQGDSKFVVRNITHDAKQHPIEPYADVMRYYDSRTPPDFYTCLMIEWQHLPRNLQQLPCPILGVTADYDIHAQTMAHWLGLYDEIVVEGDAQWHQVGGMSGRPVVTYAKLCGSSTALPPLPHGPRPTDIFFSGIGMHPYHPDKARVLQQVLCLPDINYYIQNGFTQYADYAEMLGQSKVNFTYVRYPGAMPTRGLDALSMGCATVVQRGCLLSLFVGEAEGVFTYDAAAGDLPTALRGILDNWAEIEPRARRGAEIIRREFAMTRAGSQYLRFLTFLAARPRDLSLRQPVSDFDQKRTTLRPGSNALYPEHRRQLLVRNLETWSARLGTDETPRTFADITRELTLEVAVQRETTGKADPALLNDCFATYHTALSRFPDSLALRFNFVRAGLHYGGPQEVQEALRLAAETVAQPEGGWQVGVMEDVFPWDLLPEFFNYRSYLDGVTEHLARGERTSRTLPALILAALHHYLAQASESRSAGSNGKSGDQRGRSQANLDHFAHAARLDPEFALYRLHYAQALLARRAPQETDAAIDLLIALTDGSFVWLEAFEALKDLQEKGLLQRPDFAARYETLARTEANTRRSATEGERSWTGHEARLQTGERGGETPQADTVILRSGPEREALVSALVPIYNAERYMRAHLEDLEAQTIANRMEIVICDTGSPQNEREIIEEFMRRYDNIVYIRTEHRENSHAALNRCIAAARGKYLTNANADDRHRADALEVMARALDERPDVGMVYADALITRFPNETYERNTAHSVFRWPEWSVRQLLMYNFLGAQPMWRRSLHAEHGVYNPEYIVSGDYELWLRLAWKRGAYHIPATLGLYQEGGNEARNRDLGINETKQILAHYRALIPLEDIYPGMRPNDPIARAAALIDYGNALLSSPTPDDLLTRRCYEEARALMGDHPVVMNNLGVIYSILGNVEEGMALLKPLADRDGGVASQNLQAVASHDPTYGRRAHLHVGGLLQPFLLAMPPLRNPQDTRQPVTAGVPTGAAGSRTGAGQTGAQAARKADAQRAPGVSFVIISGGKRAELLEIVLSAIRAQQIPAYEILVVGVHREAEGIRYLPAEQDVVCYRLGAMRNQGMRAARYDRIVFLDDDCVLAPDWYRAFLAGPQDYDILTMRMRLPDGTRYWDHVMTAGPGKQRIMLDDETNELVYATGGATAIRSYVADAVEWDDMMHLGEDVEYSRRCQAHGYAITHHPHCLVYHADATYTSIGRWTFRRTEGRTHRWVARDLADMTPVEIYATGEARLGRDLTAEAADCFRYGALHYPDYTLFQHALAGIERSSGGHLPGVSWYADGDPELRDILQSYGADMAILERLGLGDTPAEARAVRIRPDIERPAWDQTSRSLRRSGGLPIRLDPTDYIQEAAPLLLALEAAGANPTVQTALHGSKPQRLPVALDARLAAMAARIPGPGGVKIDCVFPPYFQPDQNPKSEHRLHVGRAMFDAEGLPKEWVDACNRMDAVWVPGEFNRRSFAAAGVDPARLAVVPGPLHMALYDPALRPLPIDGARGYNFLCILDWRRGKGWETLLRAYLQEFNADDDVALILRPRSTQGLKTPQITQAVIAFVQHVLSGNTARMPTVLLHDAEVPQENMPNLYRAADCFVLASHGEGCGRVFMEAMAMALPVIGPDWGACRDFMTRRNSFPIDCRPAPVPEMAARETPLLRGCRWAEPDVAQISRQMRRVFTDRAGARAVGLRARADVAERFSHETVAKTLRSELLKLAGRLAARVPVTAGAMPFEYPELALLSVTAEVMIG